jgi:hypothetical protein
LSHNPIARLQQTAGANMVYTKPDYFAAAHNKRQKPEKASLNCVKVIETSR